MNQVAMIGQVIYGEIVHQPKYSITFLLVVKRSFPDKFGVYHSDEIPCRVWEDKARSFKEQISDKETGIGIKGRLSVFKGILEVVVQDFQKKSDRLNDYSDPPFDDE